MKMIKIGGQWIQPGDVQHVYQDGGVTKVCMRDRLRVALGADISVRDVVDAVNAEVARHEQALRSVIVRA